MFYKIEQINDHYKKLSPWEIIGGYQSRYIFEEEQ